MFRSWLQRLTYTPRRKRGAPSISPLRFLPDCEQLGPRIAPAVTTSFNPTNGQLIVRGDSLDNDITIGRTRAGVMLVNGQRVQTSAGVVRVEQVRRITVEGRAGNDNILLRSNRGPLPKATLRGGVGNDVMVGGTGNDRIFGGAGNDTLRGGAGFNRLFGEDGADTLLWNDADNDGSALLEGGVGVDSVQATLGDASDLFSLAAAGSRAFFVRTSATPFSLDIGTSEQVTIRARSGADTGTVGNLTGTGVTEVNIDLAATLGGGDSQADAIVANGSAAADTLQAAAAGSVVQVTGLGAQLNIQNAEVANDRVTLSGLAGNDTLSAGAIGALIQLTLDGGDGDDTLNGGDGADLLQGGAGNDTIDGNVGADTAFMGAGDDLFIWDPGDGSDIIEGQDGQDTLRFNGAALAEVFAASANGDRLRFTRNLGTIVMDADGVEVLTLNALGGIDSLTVNDLAATDVRNVNVDLGVSGAGDLAIDAITVNATAAADVMSLSGGAGSVTLSSPSLTLAITNAEPLLDTLVINALGGDDVIGASGLAGTSIGLTVNGGDGNDILVGSQGNDTINGENGDDLIQGGDGNDTLDGGDGTDTIDGGDGIDVALNGEIVTNVP